MLQLDRLTQIVDIGANPIDGEPPYKVLLKNGMCNVIGFEPQRDALAQLNKNKSPNETYLPYAVGDGENKTLNICRYSGWTSTFMPSAAFLDLFNVYRENAQILERVPIETRKLDDIHEIDRIDLLKIDVQGGELEVFQNGKNKLSGAVAIQTEVSFVNLYENQPTIGEVDMELRKQGFIPQCFAAIRPGMISPLTLNGDPWQCLHQLLEADMVYVRDFRDPGNLNTSQWKNLCLIADACYGSFDLAFRCLTILEKNKSIEIGSAKRYVDLLNSPPTGAPAKYSIRP
jgi:FkbM family methyltransferase